MSEPAELGVVTIDRALTIQSWNDWLASATGLAEGDVRGQPLLSLVAPERLAIVRSMLDEVLSTGTSRVLSAAFHHFVIACPPRQPSPRFTEMQQFVTIAPLGSSVVSGAMVTIEDVTPRVDEQRDLAAQLDAGASGMPSRTAIEAVASGDWRLRGAAVRALRQRASTAEIAHLLESLRRGYDDLNVVSSALQVLAANRDVTTPLIELLSDPQADLRMHAALALGHLGDAAAAPALVRALDDVDPNVTFHAIEALGAVGAGEAVDHLAAIAQAGDFFLAFPAIDALAKTDDPRAGSALASLLDAELLRPAVVAALGAVGDEDTVVPLASILNTDPSMTTVASVAAALDAIHARALRTFGTGTHIVDLARATLTPAGVAALATAVERRTSPLSSLIQVLGWTGVDGLRTVVDVVGGAGDPDAERQAADAILAIGAAAVDPLVARLSGGERDARLAAASLLGGIGDVRAVPHLIAALDSADAELATAAAAALARLGEPRAVDPLLSMFGHQQAAVRQAAIAAVNSIGAAHTASRLRPMLDDADPRVRSSALRVAGYFGFDACMDGLFRALDDRDEDVRRAAIEQLPILDDARALARLTAALGRETPRNRAAAAHALRLAEGPSVSTALAGALGDDDVWVRYFAADALAQRGGRGDVPALTRLAEQDPAPHVRIAALRSLAAIDPFVAGDVSIPLVHDPDAEVAAAALTAVAAGGHPSADALLEEALKSGTEAVRVAAVRALPARATLQAIDLLSFAARLAEHPAVQLAAIESLGRAAGGDDPPVRAHAAGALLDVAAATDRREAALAALSARGDRVIEGVAAKLRSPRAVSRLIAVEALARLRQPQATEALAEALLDEEATVRREAVAAFGRLGARIAAGTIANLVDADPDAGVRRVAAIVCARHGWRRSGSR
jgi:HEAT repeat protein